MKFYFAGAIRGGREKLDIYIKINKLLERYGEILDKHVADPNVEKIEKNNSKEEIYNRDINWIKECDVLVAEISTPSLGVGYEISYAENLGKEIICVYDDNINISAMIGGNKNFELINYKNSNDLQNKLEDKLNSLNI
jgi:nucleoside 2-deoxyribosyltransferase